MSKHLKVEPISAPYKPINHPNNPGEPPRKVPADKLRKHLQTTTLPALEDEHKSFREVLENLKKSKSSGLSLGEVLEDATMRVGGAKFASTRRELSDWDKKDKILSGRLRSFDESQTLLSIMNPRKIMERRAIVKELTDIRHGFNRTAESYNKAIKDLNTPSKKDEIKREAIKGLKSGFRDAHKMSKGEREVTRLEKEIVNYRIMDRRLEKLRSAPVQIEKRDIKLADKELKSFKVMEDLRKRVQAPSEKRALKR
jgi:hypothetical protein